MNNITPSIPNPQAQQVQNIAGILQSNSSENEQDVGIETIATQMLAGNYASDNVSEVKSRILSNLNNVSPVLSARISRIVDAAALALQFQGFNFQGELTFDPGIRTAPITVPMQTTTQATEQQVAAMS